MSLCFSHYRDNWNYIIYINIAQSSCVNINPDQHPTYDELIKMFDSIIKKEIRLYHEKILKTKIFSAQREIEFNC